MKRMNFIRFYGPRRQSVVIVARSSRANLGCFYAGWWCFFYIHPGGTSKKPIQHQLPWVMFFVCSGEDPRFMSIFTGCWLFRGNDNHLSMFYRGPYHLRIPHVHCLGQLSRATNYEPSTLHSIRKKTHHCDIYCVG